MARAMTMAFPNESRSYDRTRDAVRFWGHMSSMECSFFVAVDALRHIHPNRLSDEASFLKAFDAHRDLICKIAEKVYARGPRGSYDVVAADF